MLTIKTVTFVVGLAVAALCGGVATQVVARVVAAPPVPKCEFPETEFDKAFRSGTIDKTGADKEY